VLYFVFLALWGVLNGNDLYWIAYELFQALHYLFIIVLVRLIKEPKHYQFLINVLIVFSIIIAVEYIFYSIFIAKYRFVTFQSGFLPIFIGILFAKILHSKKIKIGTLFSSIFLIILIVGTIMTLTRTLWVTTGLVLGLTFLLYHFYKGKKSYFKLTPLLFLIIIPLLLISDTQKFESPKTSKEVNRVDYRTESLTNPSEDASFLMRVEIGYYAFIKFTESPMIGQGLGSFLKYEILGNNNLPNYYIDNTWLYLLWKGGIIGFLLFAWIYFRFLKMAVKVYKNASSLKSKYMTLGLITGIISLLILGLLSPLLIKYKTNILFPIFIAYINVEAKEQGLFDVTKKITE
jgi:hypothetical protein